MLSVPLIFETIHKKMFKQAEASGKIDKLRKGIALSKKFKLYNNPAICRRMFKDVHALRSRVCGASDAQQCAGCEH